MPNSKCNLKIRILKSSIFAEHSSISGHTSLSLMHLYLKPRLRKKLVSYKGSSNLLLALCKANSRKHHDDTQGNIVHRRCMNSGTARCVFNIKNVSRLRMLKESWLVICQIMLRSAMISLTKPNVRSALWLPTERYFTAKVTWISSHFVLNFTLKQHFQ